MQTACTARTMFARYVVAHAGVEGSTLTPLNEADYLPQYNMIV